MNFVGHDGETTGKFPPGRGHFSCIWKKVKEFSKEEITGILGRGNRGAAQRNNLRARALMEECRVESRELDWGRLGKSLNATWKGLASPQ